MELVIPVDGGGVWTEDTGGDGQPLVLLHRRAPGRPSDAATRPDGRPRAGMRAAGPGEDHDGRYGV